MDLSEHQLVQTGHAGRDRPLRTQKSGRIPLLSSNFLRRSGPLCSCEKSSDAGEIHSQLCGFSKMRGPQRGSGPSSAATANGTDLSFSSDICGNAPFYPKEARFLRNQCDTDGWKRNSHSKRNEISL